MVQQIISDEDHDCFGRFSNTFALEGSPIFLPILRQYSFENKKICFEGKCEGVGEDSGCGLVI